MVLDFHCNKWIAGGDPTKVSGALCIGDVALVAAALKMYYLLLVCVHKNKTKQRTLMFGVTSRRELWSHEASLLHHVRKAFSSQRSDQR